MNAFLYPRRLFTVKASCLQKMRRGGSELHGDLDPLAESHFLDGTLRHEGRQREAAVNQDADMQADRAQARDGALEAIDGKRRARGRRARLERDVLGPKAEAHRLTGQGGRYIPGGSDALTGSESFINNPFTSDPVRFARNAAILEEDPTLGIGSPTVAWADTAFRAMHGFRAANYPSEIRQPILMLAASNDTIVSTAAIEEFAYHLRAGSHLVIAGSKHEILQEQDRYRAQFWAAFDAFVPGTPLFG